ncbi:hypothetical protein AVEN_13860-1 [Araneus ventricosus]|uniref:DDE-1 domain-containing protein n=1 Tax=Araneus ventricosus TaxID=182803 RepID=A0A4Y2KWF5_ARAVE|nr:hypothetical protein AVEN_13860-1 [Araneus ventricosus]
MMSQIALSATIFAKAGFFVSNENSASAEDEDDILLEELKKMWIQLRETEEINDDVLIEDFLSLDSEAETSETLTELDIWDSEKNKNNTAMNCNEDEDDEDGNDHDAENNKPSYDEMLKSFATIRRGLQFEENTPEGVFGALQRCQTYYERKHFFKQKTQTKLTDMSVIKFKDACGTIKGAKTETHLLNVCCSAAPLVGGIEERSAFILVDGLRNAAYLRLFKLCLSERAMNIFSPACVIVSGVD